MSLRYKVPQDVQREDKILIFITFKQLIILMVTGGFSYFVFIQMSKYYQMSQVEIFIIAIPFLLGIAFCFLKVKGLTLLKFLLLMMEQLFLPARRFWIPNSHTFLSMTHNFSFSGKKVKEVILTKNVSAEKIRNLAALLDNPHK